MLQDFEWMKRENTELHVALRAAALVPKPRLCHSPVTLHVHRTEPHGAGDVDAKVEAFESGVSLAPIKLDPSIFA